MSERITAKMVNDTFTVLTTVAQKSGHDTSKWFLNEGSTSHHRAWRIFIKEHDGGLTDFFGQNGFIGFTTREAYTFLQGMITAFTIKK